MRNLPAELALTFGLLIEVSAAWCCENDRRDYYGLFLLCVCVFVMGGTVGRFVGSPSVCQQASYLQSALLGIVMRAPRAKSHSNPTHFNILLSRAHM